MDSIAEFGISFWRKTDDEGELLKEVRKRYASSPPFARLLHAAVSVELRGGQVVIQGKPSAQKVIRQVLAKLKAHEVADVPAEAIGKWQWLELRENRFTGKRVWQKVSRKRAWVVSAPTSYAETPFRLMKVLAYPAGITWEQAERLWSKHRGPRGFRLIQQTQVYDRSRDLNLQDNEHFRDDRGSYDTAGILHKPQRRETWESAYATRLQAANRDCRIGTCNTTRRSRTQGEVGLAEVRAHHAGLERALSSLTTRQAAAPRHPAAGPWWTLKPAEREMLSLQEGVRARLLKDEAAEVAAHAATDVPEGMLELLEDQLAETQGKAPRGLVGALARERLASHEREAYLRQQQAGLEALTTALQA